MLTIAGRPHSTRDFCDGISRRDVLRIGTLAAMGAAGGWTLPDLLRADVPDSEANAVFGRSTGGRGDGAFPQVRKVSLVELGTHVETAIAIGGWHDGEQTRRRPQTSPDDLGLLFPRKKFLDRWVGPLLSVKRFLKSAFHESLTNQRRASRG
ncbi:MAG TPA: hypothetical protein VNH11_09685 [Pirellulales bacterium]|nr:hypothetical protein [Pirellulales bacterium]